MVVATRRRRKLDGRQLNSFKIFTIAEDPCTVLGYLRAADVARVAASCAGAAKLCLDDKVLERVAAERWLSAVRPAADLRGLFGLDRLEAEVSAWRVLRVKRVEITYEVVPQFEGLSAVAGGESALLYHARDAIALELVGASNGWFRWSKKGVDGATPFTGTPPTGQEKGDSSSLQHECSARARSGKNIHASRPLQEMIARPRMSRNEWKTAEI